MYRKLTFFICTTCALTLLCSMTLKESGDTWWYVNGQPYYWHHQQDVFAFRTIDGRKWNEPFDTQFVEYIFHRDMSHDKMNIIYFKADCPEAEKDAIKNMIRTNGWFDAEFPVITSYPDLDYNSAAWFALDDLLLVNFNPDSLNKERFNEFKADYGLQQINFPDSVFPKGIFTYIFKFDPQEAGNGIELAKSVFMQEPGLVRNVQPNLIHAYEEVSHSNSTEVESSSISEGDIEYYMIHNQNRSVKFFVKFKNQAPQCSIKVYDLFGREVEGFKVMSQNIEIEITIADYAGGIYFASIENEKGEVLGVQKFVKL